METFLSLMLLLPILNIVFSTLFLPSIFFSHLGLSPARTPAVLRGPQCGGRGPGAVPPPGVAGQPGLGAMA